MEVALLILLLFLFILLNGFFAMSEIAVVSASKTRLESMAEENEKAGTALDLANHPNRFLSTIQIGITTVGVISGAYGQATLSARLSSWLDNFAFLAPYSGFIASAVVIVAISYFTLVLGELVPKRLGMASPEPISVAVAPFMAKLAQLTAPLVTLLSGSTKLVLRLLGRGEASEKPATEAEIAAQIRKGAQEGVLEAAESSLAANVLALDDQRVSAIMTPESEVEWIDLSANPDRDRIREALRVNACSGVPVAHGSLQHVQGVLNAAAWLERGEEAGGEELQELLQKPLLVYEGKSPLDVLEQFRQHGTHLALVVDEYGSVQGSVTLEDIVGGIVGEVPEVAGPSDPDVARREDGSWLLDGMLALPRLKEVLNLRDLPGEDGGAFYSLGGLVMSQTGGVPHVSDRFEWQGYCFEVVDMDGNWVDKVLVRRLEEQRRAA